MRNSSKISGKLTIPLFLLLAISFSTLPAQAKYGGGTGEPNEPYLIFDANQMNAIGADSNDWDKHFLLMADIDLSGYIGPGPWSPPPPPPAPPPPQPLLMDVASSIYNEITFNIIGREEFPFTGVFDGNGHSISNFTSRSPDTDNIGLFGYVDGPDAEISNLGLIDPDVDAGTGWYVGSLVGNLVKGTIRDCFVEGGSVSGDDCVGGLVGNVGDRWVYIIDAVTITNCFSSGNVTGDSSVGGLVGVNYYGTITNCYSKSDVSGDYNTGGLVGFNSILATITNCYSTGSIVGATGAGGLVGDNDGTITDCNSSSDVRAFYPVGGLTGYNYEGTITNCYATGSITGDNCVGGLVGIDFRGAISRCYSTGGIDGRWQVGGLIGYNQGDINICYSSSGVIGQEEVGGLVGSGSGTITNCYSIGSVSGSSSVGGLTGENWDGTITNCYSSGRVTGGGLVGYNHECVVINSFWDIETSGQDWSDGGTGLPTAQMQAASTFILWGGCGNEGIWTLDEGNDYPHLWWEEKPGEPLPAYQLSDFITGSGTQIDPYLIYTPEQLNMIGLFLCDWDKHFKLMADIDLGGYMGTSFNIIGYYRSFSDDKPFTGVLDGNGHIISNFTYILTEGDYIGLFGYVYDGDIRNLGLIDPSVDAGTGDYIGSLVGINGGTIAGCYVEGGSVSGDNSVGGLAGVNDDGTITSCYSKSDVSGDYVGGLVGMNWDGTISNCYSKSDVSGGFNVGGLVGSNGSTITNCYSTGSVSGTSWQTGGLLGYNYYKGTLTNSFWDVETSGQDKGYGGKGKTTSEMQMQITFTDAGWDFVDETANGTNDIWFILQQDYPHLWWEIVPVLHPEPEMTLGTRNTISWEPVIGAFEYYAECAEDANFTRIIYNSNWITETSYEFTGLQAGQKYWYSVKARNIAGTESSWSNVESSLQLTLADAVERELGPESMKSKNLKKTLLNKIDTVLDMIDDGLYTNALSKLRSDILSKMNGCEETGEPDNNDWIITCEEQSRVYYLVVETIEYVKTLMGQSPD